MAEAAVTDGRGARARIRRLRSGVDGSSLVAQMGARISRDSLYYTVVTGSVFPVALVQAVILTRYLTPAEFGQLGILFFISGFTTVLLNLFFLRGTERQVWGASEEGVDVDVAELVEHHERPRVLGTGLMMGLVLAVLTIAVTIPLAPDLAQLFVHTRHLATAMIWTGVSGALGATWRLTANIGRWERRRTGFGVVWVLRPLLALAISWPLVAAGDGVAGAMAATAIGTAVSVAAGLVISRHSYSAVLDRRAMWAIGRSSGNFAAMVVGLYVLHSGDVLLLSRYASSSQVGLYKIATNVSSIVSYAVSAFLMAWSPLEFTTLFQAAYERHGRDRLRGEMAHYYLIIGIASVLVLSALATPAIALFAASYHSAGGFVAITAVGYLAYGLFLVIARSSSFPRRYFIYGVAALASAAGLIVTSIGLAGPLGGYGVAIGDIVGGLVGIAVVIFVAGVWGDLPAASVSRVTKLLLIGGGCWAVGSPVADLTGPFDAVLKITSVLAFGPLLVAMGVIPRDQIRALYAIVRASFARRARPDSLIERTAELPTADRQIVTAIARDRESAARVAVLTGLTESSVRLRLVSALRTLAAPGGPEDQDAEIAAYLLDTDSVTERDAAARSLWHEGVGAGDLHAIESAFTTLCHAPLRAWPMDKRRRSDDSLLRRWSLDRFSTQLLDTIVRRGRDPAVVAGEFGIAPLEAERRVLNALRAIADDDGVAGGPVNGRATMHPADPLIGAFLLGGDARPPAAQLWAAGVDPLELHRLELTIEQIRRVPASRWERISAQAGVTRGLLAS